MDKPDVRALAEDVPVDVWALARLTAGDIFFPDIAPEEDVRRIADAIMADRRATRETAKRLHSLEELEELAHSHAEDFIDRTDGINDQLDKRDHFIARLEAYFDNFAQVVTGTHPDQLDGTDRETAKAEAVCAKNARTDATALQQAADSLLHADAAAWKKGFTADDALARHIAQARFQIGRFIQTEDVLESIDPTDNRKTTWAKSAQVAAIPASVLPSLPAPFEEEYGYRLFTAVQMQGYGRTVYAAAKTEGRRQGLEEAALLAEAQPFYPDTHTGTRQQWVKDQIAAAIRAIAQKAEG